jgi:hypothetical protein
MKNGQTLEIWHANSEGVPLRRLRRRWRGQGYYGCHEVFFHAPKRGGKKGPCQYKEIARRFVLWRKTRDMEALIKTWQQA